MSRTRASAKAAGSRFERSVADYLNITLAKLIGFPQNVDRRVRTGAKDRGDIGGVWRRALGNDGEYLDDQRIVIECKDTSRVNLAGWARETEIERGNDDALAGVIVHKRHGVADPARQWVTMELAEFVALLTGERPAALVPSDDPGDAAEAVSGDDGRSEDTCECGDSVYSGGDCPAVGSGAYGTGCPKQPLRAFGGRMPSISRQMVDGPVPGDLVTQVRNEIDAAERQRLAETLGNTAAQVHRRTETFERGVG